MQINRRIYYNNSTGNPLLDTGEYDSPSSKETTVDYDISTYTVLSQRSRSSFDVIEVPYGMYSEDFNSCNGYHVDLSLLATLGADEKYKAITFSYPNQALTQPVYVKPLTEQNKELLNQITQMSTDFQGLTDLLSSKGVI